MVGAGDLVFGWGDWGEGQALRFCLSSFGFGVLEFGGDGDVLV